MTSIESVRKSNRRILAFVMVLLLCLTLLPGAALAANTSATTMSLMDWEGEKNVTVKASSGTSKTVRKGMSLYNGYTVTTGAGGRAWIALDGSKTITLNASSSVEVRSSGGKIDVLLNAGELNFSSDGPVGAGKNYNVITQNAVCGIIGSFGWVDSDAIGLLHGKTKVTCTDPLTGKVVVKFIDTGTLLSYVGDEAHTNGMDPALNSIGFETRRMRNEDVPAAMVQEILADPAKQLQMADVPSLDLQVLTDTLPEKLAAEAAAAEAAQAGAQAAAAAQELRVAAEAGASLTVPEGGDATVGGGAAVGDAVGTEAGGKVLDLWDAEGKDIAGTGETDVNAGATTTDDSGATTGGSGGDSGSGGGTTPDGEKHGYLSVIIPTGVGQSVDVALKRGATVISQYVEGSESATYTVLSGETLTLALGTLPDGWEWTVSAAMWITGGPEEGITAAVEGTGNTRTITVPTIGDSDVLESFIVSAVAEQSTQTQIYDITIDSSVAHGTVTATMDGEHPVTGAEAGKSVILGFTPDEGYECSAVSVVPDGGGEVETSAISDNGCTFTMPAKPVTVYANFTPRTYNVTLHTEGGTINAGNVTSYTYNVDALLPTDVTRDGFRFDGWYDAASGGTTSIGIIAAGASGAQEYWAYWTQLYGVTVTQPQNGTLSADKTTAAAGETVTLTVTPATDYVLDTLTVTAADSSTVTVSGNNTFTMPAQAITVTATFKAVTYDVTVTTPTNGTVTADKAVAAKGETVTLTVTPATDYVLDTLTVTAADSSTVTVSGNNTFTMPAQAVTVAATFRAKETVATPTFGTTDTTFETAFTLSLSCETEGASIHYTTDGSTPTSASALYPSDGIQITDTATVKAIAVKDGMLDSAVAEKTFTRIYRVTVTTPANGTVTSGIEDGQTAQLFAVGDTVVLTVTPDTDYLLDTLTVKDEDGNPITVSNNSFTMPAKAVTVTATFKAVTYAVTIDSDITHGTVVADKQTAAAGETVTLTVTPATGYEVSSAQHAVRAQYFNTQYNEYASVDATQDGTDPTKWTFTMPAGDATVSAAFAPAVYPVKLNENGGTFGESHVQNYTYGVGATLPDDLTREGFRFDGWYDAASGGSRVTAIGADETGAKEYWARWTQLYTVTVTQPQNGTVTADKQTAAAGETVTLTVTPATGYELDALTATYGNDLTVEPTQDSDDDTKWSFAMPAGDATVSAAFAPAVYPVKLNENGGTFGQSHVQNYTYGVGATLPDDLTREGFRFDGWYDAASGGSRVTAIGAEETGAKEYWAHWTQLYTVTVDATITGGTVTADREIAAAGETVTLTVSPSEGWEVSSAQHAVRAQYFNTQANENASVDATQAQGNAATWTFTMPEGDATVYAAFVKTTYAISGLDDVANGTIEWSVNGLTHEPNATPQAQVGDTVTLTLRGRADDPPAPPSAPPQYIDAGLEVQCEDETPVTATLSGTRTTYEYTYEYGTTDPVELTGTGYAATYTFVMPAGNVMVSAQFATVCELTFDPGDGNGTGYGDVAAAGAGYILPACTFTPPEDGMAFAGWSDGYSDKFYAAGSTYTIDANVASVVFTAMWGISEDLHGSVDVSELVKQSDYAGMTVAVTNDDMAYTDLSTEGYLLFGVGLGDMLQIELRDANGNGIAGLNVTATVYCDPSFSADWSSYITSTSEDGVFVMSLPEVVEGTDNPLSSLILTFTAG